MPLRRWKVLGAFGISRRLLFSGDNSRVSEAEVMRLRSSTPCGSVIGEQPMVVSRMFSRRRCCRRAQLRPRGTKYGLRVALLGPRLLNANCDCDRQYGLRRRTNMVGLLSR